MSDIKKVRDFRKSRQPKRQPSPEAVKQARETFVNLLAPIVEKMMKSSETIRPVKESWSEIIDGINNEIAREPVVINHSDGRRIQYDADGSQTPLGVTKSLSGDAKRSAETTKTDVSDVERSAEVTKFDSSELAILERLKNEISER